MAASPVIYIAQARVNPVTPQQPVLKNTKDSNQKTFTTKNVNVLRRWRTALKIRYTELLKDFGDFNVIWKDSTFDKKEVKLKDLRSGTTPLPDDLAQSFVQVRSGDENLITVTLYFKKARRHGGTCLVQGLKCSKWAQTEFHQLVAMVGTLDSAERLEQEWMTSPLCGPAIAQLPSSEQAGEATPSLTSKSVSSDLSLTEDYSSSPSSPTTGAAVSGGHITTPLCPVTPLSDRCPRSKVSPSTSVVTSCPPSWPSLLSDITPSGPTTDCQPESPFIPPITTPQSPTPQTSLRDSVMATSSQTDTLAAPSTNCGPPSLRDLVATAHHGRLLAQALQAVNVLNTTVQALTQELSHTRQKLDATTLEVQRLEAVCRDTTVKATNTCKVSDRDVTSVRNKIHSLEVRVTNLTSARKTQGSAIKDLKKQIKKISNTTAETPSPCGPTKTPLLSTADSAATGSAIPVIVTPNRGDTDHPANPQTRKDSQPVGHGHNRTLAARPVSLDKSKARQRETDNHLNQPHGMDPNRVPTRTREYRQPPDMSPSCAPASRRLTPAQNLSTRRVLDSTDHVIIGDSVLRRMQGRKMVCTRSERVQIISVSGMSTEDLMGWLTSQPEAPHVDAVTVHVGVNDCRRREVTCYQWDQLLEECWRVFPRAKLQVSTILPPKVVNSKLSFPVMASNANLTYSCRKLGATLIDNTSTFAPNGRPLSELYRHERHDLVHVSHKGMVCLARNIRRVRSMDCARKGEEEGTELSEDIARRLSELRRGRDMHSDNNSDTNGSYSPSPMTEQRHQSPHLSGPESMSRYTHSPYIQHPWLHYGMNTHMPYGLSELCVRAV